MKRLLIFCSGFIFILGGCEQTVTHRFGAPSSDIQVADDSALPQNVQEQLIEIDQKLARIDSQLDQRLSAMERRLLIIENSGTRPSPEAADTNDLGHMVDQLATVDPVANVTPAPTNIGTDPTDLISNVSAVEHEYVGPKACAACHMPQYASWRTTKMANAFEALKPGVSVEMKLQHNLDPQLDYTKVATCVGCHVTGYGEKGGFVDYETTPHMAGVSCESCHGPGGSYIAKGIKKNPQFKMVDIVAEGFVHPITVTQCQGCHNTNSPLVDENYVFDFEANKEKGTHQHFPLQFKH